MFFFPFNFICILRHTKKYSYFLRRKFQAYRIRCTCNIYTNKNDQICTLSFPIYLPLTKQPYPYSELKLIPKPLLGFLSTSAMKMIQTSNGYRTMRRYNLEDELSVNKVTWQDVIDNMCFQPKAVWGWQRNFRWKASRIMYCEQHYCLRCLVEACERVPW